MNSSCSLLLLALCSASAMEDMEVTLEVERLLSPLPAKIVLLLDVSGSMHHQNRNHKLIHAVHRWIEQHIPDNLMLGIVQFSTRADVLSKLQLVGVNRTLLLRNIPKTMYGNTCLGCGLKRALALFAGDTMNSVIILVTDGDNSEPGQGIDDVLSLVERSGVKIVTVIFGDSVNDNTERLAEVSQGLTYYVRDVEGVTALSGALQDALTLVEPPPPQPIILFEIEQSSSSSLLSGVFEIDATVADNVQLCVYYGPGNVVDKILLIMPNGQLYATEEAEHDYRQRTITFNLQHTMVGSWQLAIESKSFNKFISVIVSSPPKSKRDIDPIMLNCWVKVGGPISIHAAVKKGEAAVVNAQVRAELAFPDGSFTSIPLWDNGAGSDNVKYDGQYSRFAPPALPVGRYSVRCLAEGLSNTTVIHVDDANRTYMLSSGNFTRITRTTSFKILTTEQPGQYPPSSIRDLHLVALHGIYYILNFTAPGSELDWGEASSYRLILVPSRLDASNSSSWNAAINISQPPAPSGSSDIIIVSKQPSQMFISICAVGTTGLLGNPSNIVELPAINFKQDITTRTSTPWDMYEDNSSKGNIGNTSGTDETSHKQNRSINRISNTMLILITSVTIFCIFAILISIKLLFPRFRASYQLVKSK